MKQINWFDRKFDFSTQENILPSIVERLQGTPLKLQSLLNQTPSDLLEVKPNHTWSIKENIGHLSDLEPLWQGRLEDILKNNKYLRETDLNNTKTDLAEHNKKDIQELLSQFEELRNETLKMLSQLDEVDIFKSALHPRLEQSMRTMDLFLFVAEHDDHHVQRISQIIKP